MPSTIITGWVPGLKKVEHTKLVRHHSGMDLRDAKRVTDRVLDKETVAIAMPTIEEAELLAAKLRAIGALAQACK